MKRQAFNPYLPEYEYIPDGEPYMFGDRVYVYGSHDRFGAPMFCMNDYVCWSASADDLSDWRYEGVIYRKNQDPKNRLGIRLLFAPDVARGVDGKYYLYYAFDFMGIMGVAVSDSPTGPFEFYGHVQYADGTVWGRKKEDSFPFDPGIFVDDDGRVYLYSGFYTPVPGIVTGFRSLEFGGGYVLELEQDMKTIRTPEKLLFPKEGPGSFAGHEFFEASSMRKYNGKYYIFYHRHTNRSSYARQACAEEIIMDENGMFRQAEMTSCGLNGGPLKGVGTYPARIACNLWSKDGTGRYDCKNPKKAFAEHPYFTQDKKDGDGSARQYIANMRDGAVAGFKYFVMGEAKEISVELAGKAKGKMLVSGNRDFSAINAEIPVENLNNVKTDFTAKLIAGKGKRALYFEYKGEGYVDFISFTLK